MTLSSPPSLSSPAKRPSRSLLLAILVFSTALSVRLVYLAQMEQSPFYDITLLVGEGDSYRWFTWAVQIYETGNWTGVGEPRWSPFYPYFLALIFKLTAGANLLIPRFVQAFLGSIVAALVFDIARRLKGELAGLLAGLFTACYGVLIFYDGALLRDTLLVHLNLAIIYAMFRAQERAGFIWSLLAGLFFGLSFLIKPNILIMLPIFGLWLWELPRLKREESGEAGASSRAAQSGRLKILAGLALGSALMLSLLAARNLAAKAPLLSFSQQQGAYEFITGNHPEAPYLGWQPTPEIEARSRASDGGLAQGVVLVLKIYRHDPLALLGRQLAKTWFFLYGYEVPSSQSYYVEQLYVSLLRLPWVNWPVILGLGLIGMIALRARWRWALPLFGYLLLFSLATIAFYITDRFRIPVVPELCVLAGIGAEEIYNRFRGRRAASGATLLFLALGVMVLVWPREKDVLQPTDYHNLVRFHLIKKEPEKARALIEEGKSRTARILAEKEGALYRYRLARLKFTAGDPLDEVEAELGLARELGPPRWLAAMMSALAERCEEQREQGDPKKFGFRL